MYFVSRGFEAEAGFPRVWRITQSSTNLKQSKLRTFDPISDKPKLGPCLNAQNNLIYTHRIFTIFAIYANVINLRWINSNAIMNKSLHVTDVPISLVFNAVISVSKLLTNQNLFYNSSYSFTWGIIIILWIHRKEFHQTHLSVYKQRLQR